MCPFIRKFLTKNDGVAAVEFALIAPIMIALFLGMIEIADALDAKRKVTSATSTAADLVARAKGVGDSDIDDVFAAVHAILEPLDSSKAKIRITSVNVELNGDVVVGWSDGQNIAANTAGDPYTLARGVGEKGGSVIVAEVTYVHPGLTGTVVARFQTFSDTFMSKPRRTLQVARY